MNKQIMVIEDAQELLELYQMILGDYGYEVDLHSSWQPEQDLNYIRERQPALVIADLLIKGQAQGLEVMRHLRSDQKTAHIPIILCTAALTKLREIRPELEMQNVIIVEKPFDVETLMSTVAQCVPTQFMCATN